MAGRIADQSGEFGGREVSYTEEVAWGEGGRLWCCWRAVRSMLLWAWADAEAVDRRAEESGGRHREFCSLPNVCVEDVLLLSMVLVVDKSKKQKF